MDDFGYQINFDEHENRMNLLWIIFHFYGMLDESQGCLNVFCAQFCDPRDNEL